MPCSHVCCQRYQVAHWRFAHFLPCLSQASQTQVAQLLLLLVPQKLVHS